MKKRRKAADEALSQIAASVDTLVKTASSIDQRMQNLLTLREAEARVSGLKQILARYKSMGDAGNIVENTREILEELRALTRNKSEQTGCLPLRAPGLTGAGSGDGIGDSNDSTPASTVRGGGGGVEAVVLPAAVAATLGAMRVQQRTGPAMTVLTEAPAVVLPIAVAAVTTMTAWPAQVPAAAETLPAVIFPVATAIRRVTGMRWQVVSATMGFVGMSMVVLSTAAVEVPGEATKDAGPAPLHSVRGQAPAVVK